MGEEHPRGQSRPDLAGLSSESGWVTTDVAARAVRVSPRTIRRYIDQGRLEAKPQGEGVRREWLVSVDSLQGLRATRTFEAEHPRRDRVDSADTDAATPADSIAEVLRDMATRLEWRAEEAAELRVRLELTDRAQSTLEGERRRALEDLEEERRRREEAEREREDLRRELEARRRREEAEREREDLRRELEALREARESPESAASAGAPGESPTPTGGTQEATEEPEAGGERRSWWSRVFGGP
jgi:hypothetical protein